MAAASAFHQRGEMGELAQTYFACQTFNALPLSGGILEQPRQLMLGLMGFHVGHELEKSKARQKELERLERKRKRR